MKIANTRKFYLRDVRKEKKKKVASISKVPLANTIAHQMSNEIPSAITHYTVHEIHFWKTAINQI